MKHYYLADGTPLKEETAKKIMESNRRILAHPADEFVRRVNELRFIVATEA